jgi:tetratricopeptide (TPR) repeat protein
VEDSDLKRNPELKATLTRLEKATEGLSVDEQIGILDEAAQDPANAEFKADIEVQMAGVLWAYGRINEAASLMVKRADKNIDNNSVQYFAGQHLLELRQFARAMPFLDRCIEIERASGETWYLDSAYLLRAYCAAKIGNVAQARRDVANLDDEPMHWVEADPIVSKASINAMIGD